MKPAVVAKLLALNQAFYEEQATSFAGSRAQPQPGFQRLLAFWPGPEVAVLDVGCGDGRFGRFLRAQQPAALYVGIDFSPELLAIARAASGPQQNFYQRDISQPDCLAGLGQFELIVCLAALHHIPGAANRLSLLQEMKAHLAVNGRLMLSTWQFLNSARQARKVRPWSEIGLSAADVEANDYLLTWQRQGFAYRYACMIDAAQTVELARATDLTIIEQFHSDGKEGDLGLYTILEKAIP